MAFLCDYDNVTMFGFDDLLFISFAQYFSHITHNFSKSHIVYTTFLIICPCQHTKQKL